jgi:hypothetical protein
MNKSTKLALGVVAAAAAGILVYRLIRKQRETNRLRKISNEGYETAHDVLYPKKESGKNRLKFGPVIPH